MAGDAAFTIRLSREELAELKAYAPRGSFSGWVRSTLLAAARGERKMPVAPQQAPLLLAPRPPEQRPKPATLPKDRPRGGLARFASSQSAQEIADALAKRKPSNPQG